MLDEPHIRPLTAYAARLRERGSGEVPEFDPLDGGVYAQILFLFEKPGRMTANNRGSGFISRNNDDQTAKATFEFMRRAGIRREMTITWNIIPWWNGTRKVTAGELRSGLDCLEDLIAILQNLRAVVLVGHRAAQAKRYLQEKHSCVQVFSSPHPSPLVRARFPDRWNAIPTQWARILDVIGPRRNN